MKERHPLWNFLPSSVVVPLATLGPLGQLKAPGTWGSVAAIPLYAVFFVPLLPVPFLLLNLLLLYLAVLICGEAEVRLGQRDPGRIVLDEFAAFPLCFLGFTIPAGTIGAPWILGGFLLFRLFDIAKPFWISRLQRLPGGWGVVADDVAAAIATNLVLQLIALFFFSHG